MGAVEQTKRPAPESARGTSMVPPQQKRHSDQGVWTDDSPSGVSLQAGSVTIIETSAIPPPLRPTVRRIRLPPRRPVQF